MEKMNEKYSVGLPPRPCSSTHQNPKFPNHGGALPEKPQHTFEAEVAWYRNKYPNIDASRCKRLLSNKLSAARARKKQLELTHELESMVKALEAEKMKLCAQIAEVQQQKQLIQTENYLIQQRLCAIEVQEPIKNAITENSRAELSWLTQLYESQKQHQQEQEEQEQNLEFLCNWETETQRVGSRSFDQSGAMAYGNESLPGEENT